MAKLATITAQHIQCHQLYPRRNDLPFTCCGARSAGIERRVAMKAYRDEARVSNRVVKSLVQRRTGRMLCQSWEAHVDGGMFL